MCVLQKSSFLEIICHIFCIMATVVDDNRYGAIVVSGAQRIEIPLNIARSQAPDIPVCQPESVVQTSHFCPSCGDKFQNRWPQRGMGLTAQEVGVQYVTKQSKVTSKEGTVGETLAFQCVFCYIAELERRLNMSRSRPCSFGLDELEKKCDDVQMTDELEEEFACLDLSDALMASSKRVKITMKINVERKTLQCYGR